MFRIHFQKCKREQLTRSRYLQKQKSYLEFSEKICTPPTVVYDPSVLPAILAILRGYCMVCYGSVIGLKPIYMTFWDSFGVF